MTIIGIGVDIVDVPRFEEHLQRTPELLDRLFGPRERARAGGRPRTAESLAARFAAKEAVTKALRCTRRFPWHEVEVVTGPEGAPSLRLSGSVAARLEELGGTRMHISLTHDAALACAYVIAES